MPNRIIRPGIMTSERVCGLSFTDRWIYLGLLLTADDYGRFEAQLQVLRAQTMPLDLGTISERDYESGLRKIEEAGLVKLYQVKGKEYGELRGFNQRRRAESKYPGPSDDGHVSADGGQMTGTRPSNDGLGGGVVKGVAEGGGDPAREETGPQFRRDFWDNYPASTNKTHPQVAERVWYGLSAEDRSKAVVAVKRYAVAKANTDKVLRPDRFLEAGADFWSQFTEPKQQRGTEAWGVQ